MMSSASPVIPAMRLAVSRADHWGLAAKECLMQLVPLPFGANIGWLYTTENFAGDLPSILTFLRETTHIRHWIGAAVPGLTAAGDRLDPCEIHDGSAVAVLAGALPPSSFRIFAEMDGPESLEHFKASLTWVHGDPRSPGLSAILDVLATHTDRLAGGLVSSDAVTAQIADVPTCGGISGVAFGPCFGVEIGLAQGCLPLGPPHLVTEAWNGVVVSLDGEPATTVLAREAGDLIARDLHSAVGFIHAALPDGGADGYQVRPLVGLDPHQGWLALGQRIRENQRLMLVRRDGNAAQKEFSRMTGDLRTRLAGRRPLAAFYAVCQERGQRLFWPEGEEISRIRTALGGNVPVIGFFTNGELLDGRLHAYSGVLAVLTDPAAPMS